MTSRTSTDPAYLGARDRGTEGLELFANYQVAPQSVPSGSSEEGSDAAADAQQGQCAAVIAKLATHGCTPGSGRFLSRDDLVQLTGIPATALCARLAPSGPLQTMREISVTDKAGVSAKGREVYGYQLTESGVQAVIAAGRESMIGSAMHESRPWAAA